MIKNVTGFVFSILLSYTLTAQTTFIGGGGDNNWNTLANWSSGVPDAADDVIISDGMTVDVNVDGQCASLIFADNNTTTTLNINSGITLTVSGDINFGNPVVDGTNEILNVDDGNLIASNIYLPNTGSNAQDDQVWVSDGTITVSGSIIAAAGNGARNYIDCSPGGVNGTGTITIGGDFYASNNTNIFNRGNSTVIYNGNGDQIVGNFSYFNLQLNGNGNKNLLGNIIVRDGGTLTLTNGILNLNGYYLYLYVDYSIAGSFSSSSMIDFQNDGYIYINSNSADDLEGTFPLGYGADYNPLTISNVTNDVGGTLNIYLYKEKHPLTDGINNCLTKYVSFTSTNLIGTQFDASFTYSDDDIPGIEGDLDEAGYLTSAGWMTSTANPANLSYNHGSNTIALSNVTNWGDLTLGESSGCFDGALPDKYTVAPGNWNIGSTWNGGTVPVDGDNVVILHSTITLNIAATVNSLTIGTGGTLNLNNQDFTVSTTSIIDGSLIDANNTGTNIFTGKVTVNNGGSFTSASNSTFEFGNGIENNGTFALTGNAAVINFVTNNQVLSGTGSITLDRTITIAGGISVTNQASDLIVEGIINGTDGTSSLINQSVISFQYVTASFATAGVFDAASFAGNTVRYNGIGDQYIIPLTYQNLILEDNNSNRSNKLLSGNATVNSDFTLEDQTDFYPVGYSLNVAGTATIKDRIYDNDAAGTCTFSGSAVIDGATFDGSVDGNIVFNGTLTALTSGFTIDRCNFTFVPDLVIQSGVTISVIDGNGAKSFGNIIIENGGIWENTGNSAITITGDLTVNTGATYTQGNGTYTFNGTAKEINGTIVSLTFHSLDVTGTITNQIDDLTVTGTLNVTNPGTFTNNDNNIANVITLAGTGEFIQGSNSELYISNNASITTLTATASGNLVEYTSAGNENVIGTTYHYLTVRNGNTKTLLENASVNGDFNIISGTSFNPNTYDFSVTGTTTIAGTYYDGGLPGTTNLQNVNLSGGTINGGQNGIVNILGNLIMPTGDGTIGRVDLTVTGTTTVPDGRTLTLNNANGNKIFIGKITVNGPGGNWVNSGNESLELRNGLEFNGATFTSGTGTYTFTTNNQALSGASAMTFSGAVTVGSGVNLTNNNTEATSGVTINGLLDGTDGTSVFTNDGILNYEYPTEPMLNGMLDVDASGNVFNYARAGNQNIAGVIYDNLVFSNSGNRTLQNSLIVNDLFTASDAVNTVCGTSDLTLSGPVTFTSMGTFSTGANTVTYNSAGDQDVINATYSGQLVIAGSGIKSLLGDASVTGALSINGGTLELSSNNLATLNSVIIASGATLDVDANAQLLIANNQTLTNNGTFQVIGTTGNEAVVTINGAGNYYITQTSAGAEISAQYYQFNYLNDGIVISDGSINATNNFSNGSFSNGTGAQYINTTGIDVTGMGNIINTTFNVGPAYNVTRTAGTGTMTFEDASGVLAGENFDNDNGNPGSLITWSYPGSTFYSNPLGTFSAGTLSDWTRNPDGTGGNPSSLSDGLATLIVQDGHTVSLDNAGGDINILELQVGEGTSGIFRIGQDGTQRTLTIQEKLEVEAGGLLNVVSTGAPSHRLIMNGNLVNNGTINLRTTSSNVVNTEFNGASSLISGSMSPVFNDVTFKSGCNVTASVPLDINNNVFLETNSIFRDGGLIHHVAGSWTADGTASMTGSGTIVFDGIVNTIEDGTAGSFTFGSVTFSGGAAASIQENIIITGNFEIDNSTTCNIANHSINVAGDFTVNSGSTYSQSANTLTLDGTGPQALDFSGNATFNNLYFSNGGANAKTISGDFTASNRVTISSGSTVGGTGNYTIAGGLLIDGTCNFSGTVILTGNYLLTN